MKSFKNFPILLNKIIIKGFKNTHALRTSCLILSKHFLGVKLPLTTIFQMTTQKFSDYKIKVTTRATSIY